MEPIENRELRGVSIRTLIIVISCTISIMATVMGTYAALSGSIKQIEFQVGKDSGLNDLKMRNLEQKIDMNSLRIKEINEKIEARSQKYSQ